MSKDYSKNVKLNASLQSRIVMFMTMQNKLVVNDKTLINDGNYMCPHDRLTF